MKKMKIKRTIQFLKDIKVNNTRVWFQEHKAEYDAVRRDFEEGIECALRRIAEFDNSISHLRVKDVTYRFYRDTRFSPDKSPYKTHLGAYMAAHGKKALHGGYYIHLEPDHCLLACGNYWLPTHVLTSCRNEILSNVEEWKRVVENERFLELFGRVGQGNWNGEKGFGLEHLKTAPSGFPRDSEYVHYLRMKNYCCWTSVPDRFFEKENWLDEMAEIFQVGKPMMDFINNVIDDYE